MSSASKRLRDILALSVTEAAQHILALLRRTTGPVYYSINGIFLYLLNLENVLYFLKICAIM